MSLSLPLQQLMMIEADISTIRLMRRELQKHCATHEVAESRVWLDGKTLRAWLSSGETETEIEIEPPVSCVFPEEMGTPS